MILSLFLAIYVVGAVICLAWLWETGGDEGWAKLGYIPIAACWLVVLFLL